MTDSIEPLSDLRTLITAPIDEVMRLRAENERMQTNYELLGDDYKQLSIDNGLLRAENERLKTLVRAATKLIDPVEQYRWHDEARAALEQKP